MKFIILGKYIYIKKLNTFYINIISTVDPVFYKWVRIFHREF